MNFQMTVFFVYSIGQYRAMRGLWWKIMRAAVSIDLHSQRAEYANCSNYQRPSA